MVGNDDWVQWVEPIATAEAAKVASRFRGIVESDDVVNELWVWMLEHPDKVQEWYENEDVTMAGFALMVEAKRYAKREKASRSGYSLQDEHYYTVPVLRELMADVFDHDGWSLQSTPSDGQPKAKADPRMSGERMVMLADVSQALQSLPQAHYNVLVWRWKYDYSDELLAAELDCTEEAAQKRIQRALKALQRALGGTDPFREYTGSRKAKSNAQAMAETQGQING
jgi:RNA polymerase sigma factor (sigma-70 family)